MTTGLDDGVPDKDCPDDTCLMYAADAGTRWAYHNAPYTLTHAVLENGTGVTTNSFTTNELSLKTGISGLWFPSGYNEIFASKARSAARFGLLMLNKGVWKNDSITPSLRAGVARRKQVCARAPLPGDHGPVA